MKPILATPFARTSAYFGAALALTFGIAACVPAPRPAPTPAPAPVVRAPMPAPASAPPPTYSSWMDAPQTVGDWRYQSQGNGSVAMFGQGQGAAQFGLACDQAARQITLSRAGQAGGDASLIVRTETATRALAARLNASQMLSTSLTSADPLLDAMAMTKGRFAVEAAGVPTLYLPAWSEVTRVIEDCR